MSLLVDLATRDMQRMQHHGSALLCPHVTGPLHDDRPQIVPVHCSELEMLKAI